MTKKHLNLISILIRVWLHRTPFLLLLLLLNHIWPSWTQKRFLDLIDSCILIRKHWNIDQGDRLEGFSRSNIYLHESERVRKLWKYQNFNSWIWLIGHFPYFHLVFNLICYNGVYFPFELILIFRIISRQTSEADQSDLNSLSPPFASLN